MILKGTIVQGMGYANYSIGQQIDEFDKRGLNVGNMYKGTINIRLENKCKLEPTIIIPNLQWKNNEKIVTENFGFIRLKSIKINNTKILPVNGYIYLASESPHRPTNGFFEKIEIICQKIENINTGQKIEVEV